MTDRQRQLTKTLKNLAKCFEVPVPDLEIRGKGRTHYVPCTTIVFGGHDEQYDFAMLVHEFAHHLQWTRVCSTRHDLRFWRTVVEILVNAGVCPSLYPWQEIEYPSGVRYAKKYGWIDHVCSTVSKAEKAST